jgi:hypothetical protein
MRLLFVRAVLTLAGILTASGSASGQTRAIEDAKDPLRRCGLPRGGLTREAHAIRCAERFVARQGYAADSSKVDTGTVVSEGIEWARTKREWLAYRRKSLEPRAHGVCSRADGGFDVAFLNRNDPKSARGVSMDSSFGSLRVEHSSFNLHVLRDRKSGCRPLRPQKR